MKKLIVAVILAAIIGGIVANRDKVSDLFSTTYVAENIATQESEVITERVVEKELDVRIEEALERELPAIEDEAARMLAEAEATAKAEYEAALAAAASTSQEYITDETTKVTDKVKEDYIAEIEETITSPSY